MPANILVFLNSYKDNTSPTNNPLQNIFKYTREINGLPVNRSSSVELQIEPSGSRDLFDGERKLNQDIKTTYSITPVGTSTSLFQLEWVSGPAPDFRTLRTIGVDDTTEITVTVSGYVATLTSTNGTALDTSGISVGDQILIGSVFNLSNQGVYTIISTGANSISIENKNAVGEVVTLGPTYANDFRVFSSGEVQIGDTLNIFGGFSPASRDTYQITYVQDNLIRFFSGVPLPTELSVQTQDIVIYSRAKKIFYLETDQPVQLTVNGNVESNIYPMNEANFQSVGFFLKSSTIWSITVQNLSVEPANIYTASVE